MEFGLHAFFALTTAFLVTFYLVPLFIKVARKFGIMDCPDGGLKKHKAPTPYLGGLAIYVGLVVSMALVLPFEHPFFLFIFASSILLFIGLLDDLVQLTPGQKFFGQFLATLCYLKAGFYLKVAFFGSFWNIVISAFWFMVMSNAFNLIDVMDGLATTTALSIACAYLIFAFLMGQQALCLLLLCFIGALLAFLWFNRPPARIYLGDSGSLFFGGFLGCIPFTISWSEYNDFGYLIPIIVSAVPLMEWGTLIVVRTYKGIAFYRGSPDHFSIYLQQNGWRKNAILGYVATMTAFAATVSLIFFYGILNWQELAFLALFFMSLWFFFLLRR